MVRTSGRTMEENVICVEKKKKKKKKIELRDVISRRKKVIFERYFTRSIDESFVLLCSKLEDTSSR